MVVYCQSPICKERSLFPVCSITILLVLSLFINIVLGERSQCWVLFIIIWVFPINVFFGYYILKSKLMFGQWIFILHLIKTVGILVITEMYGLRLEGYLTADDSGFEFAAHNIYHGIDWPKYTNYPDICAGIYHVTGENPPLILFINACLMTGVLVVFCKTLDLFELKKSKLLSILFLVISLNPYFMYSSFTYLREAGEVFFSILSLFYFLKWFVDSRRMCCFVACLVTTLPAIFLHAGYVVFTLIYLVVFFAVKLKQTRYVMLKMILIPVIVLFSFYIFRWMLSTFFHIDDLMIALQNTQKYGIEAGGGSIYTQNLQLASYTDLPLYCLKRVYYFLFSPTPTFWRGFQDAILFLTDSSFAIISIVIGFWYSIRERNGIHPDCKRTVKMLLFIVFIVAVVFGMGTNTAGTAIRHRNVLVPIYGIILSVVICTKTKSGKCRFLGDIAMLKSTS